MEANTNLEQTAGPNRLTFWSKLCYAIGGAPYQITGTALGFFLQIFLLDVAQLGPLDASIILFVGIVWTAITDFTVGFLVSRSRSTRIGCMMPWILCSTPFAVLTYLLIWFVPPFEQGKVVWYLVFYCLFQSMQTCFQVPYSSLPMFISTNRKERDSATAYCMTIEVLGTVLGTAIQGKIVGGTNDCPAEFDAANSGNRSKSTVSTASLEESKQSYLVASGVICIIYMLCTLALFFGVKERQESERYRGQLLTFRRGLYMVMSHGPYVRLVIIFFFTFLAFMLLEVNFVLFLTYTIGHKKDFQDILMVIMLFGALSIQWWRWFLTWFAKDMTVYIGITLFHCVIILIEITYTDLINSYLVLVAAGMAMGAALLLPRSILPQVVDDFKVKNPGVQGHEVVFYSLFVFFIKFVSGVSLGISTLSLKFAGYEAGACFQPEAVNVTLRTLVSPVPVVLIVVGLLILKTYPIDVKMRQENQNQQQETQECDTDVQPSQPAVMSSDEEQQAAATAL